MSRDNKILLVTQKNANIEDPKTTDLFDVGAIANVKQLLKLPGGTVRVLIEGLSWVQNFLEIEPFF